ncbi:uncharacterized protein LOC123551709 [Mercenaria mercenaria]|uniref:uncharacterized protein LOC123551709 n=1 Tax=Mercenaria mercenaria TaxID=6596 RepID=UPI00234EE58F|nr:uncharacterized protein LOC123551709 [Mercenaria mercenaria]
MLVRVQCMLLYFTCYNFRNERLSKMMGLNHRTHSVWVSPNVTMPSINTTPAEDVLINGCVSNFSTIACIRSSLLTFLAVMTAVLCVLKVIRLHNAHHQNWHQYFIFYCASLECTIGAVHWVLSLYVQFDFVLQWLKLAQFLVMCHFYWTLATRALRREVWTKKFLLPFLVIACLYFTTVAILGIVNVQDTFTECFQPYWIMMSSAEFVIVQLFCVAGFYITRRLNEISTLDSVRRSQKRDLWCIVVVFELSALIGVLYDMTLRIVGDEESGCSAIFKHMQDFFSVIYFTFMVCKLLLPIWVMLFVFKPTPQALVENDDLIPALNDDGNSAFSTNTDEQYRQLYHPAENYDSFSNDLPGDYSPSSGYSTASPRGVANTKVNGVANNIYKAAQPNNLVAITEEVDTSHQVPNSQKSSVKNNNKPPQQSSSRVDQQSVKSNVNNANDRQDLHTSTETEQKSGAQSAEIQNGEMNQSKSSEPVVTTGQTQVKEPDIFKTPPTKVVPKSNGPKFTINSDDSGDESPPPKGKFYI